MNRKKVLAMLLTITTISGGATSAFAAEQPVISQDEISILEEDMDSMQDDCSDEYAEDENIVLAEEASEMEADLDMDESVEEQSEEVAVEVAAADEEEVDLGIDAITLEDAEGTVDLATEHKYAAVKNKVQEKYGFAFQVLDLVNKERKAAGLPALTMDVSLLETAMLRANETTLVWDHYRPDGTECFTANRLMWAENIAAGQTTPESVMYSWMHSEGHRNNIMNPSYKSIGIGCVYAGGHYYWVQNFGPQLTQKASASSYSDVTKTRTISVMDMPGLYYFGEFWVDKKKMMKGDSAKVTATWESRPMTMSGVRIVSSDPGVCQVSGSSLKAVGNGKAKVTIYYPGYKTGGVSYNIYVGPQPTVYNTITPIASGLKLYWNKQTVNATSYQLQYDTDTHFGSPKTITISSTSTLAKKVTGLKANKKYYVRIRTYRTVGGKKHYSAWSAKKAVTTK